MADITPGRPEPAQPPDAWCQLRRLTPARIGLGRVGASLPTQPLLAFDLAHAQARDAVHAPFDARALALDLRASAVVASQARDRTEYLLRPDLGRSLDEDSRARVAALALSAHPGGLAIVVADGLSSVAAARHAAPLLAAIRPRLSTLPAAQFENVTVVVAKYARVALGDEVGELLGARAVVVLIGERPGLSSSDSLGLYFTWAPRVGRTDAERNCISNVRPEGLDYPQAAQRLLYLLAQAHRLQRSGVGLKDDSDAAGPELP